MQPRKPYGICSNFAADVKEEIEKWWEPAYVEFLLDGLRRAGLDIWRR